MDVIDVFISSRCEDRFSDEPNAPLLRALRARARDRLDTFRMAPGGPLFRTYVNDDAPRDEPIEKWRSACLKRVRDSAIVIVLVNGHAGYAEAGENGICHDEFLEALNHSPKTLRVIRLPDGVPPPGPPGESTRQRVRRERLAQERWQRFEAAITSNLVGAVVERSGDLPGTICAEVQSALMSLSREGAARCREGRYHRGEALEWRRASYAERASRMVAALRACLEERAEDAWGSSAVALHADDALVVAPVSVARSPAAAAKGAGEPSGPALFALGAIPDLFGIPAAREFVGQPFLRDMAITERDLPTEVAGLTVVGPVHLIACHQGVTPTQAQKVLGVPDAVIVATPFGVFAADPQSRAQIAFLAQCRDEGALRDRCRLFFEWLRDTNEGPLLLSRAATRLRVLEAMACRDVYPAAETPRKE